MQISGTTRVFLVMGDPVAQVRAPQIFNGLFERHGVDAVLVPAHVRPQHFAAVAAHALAVGNIGGLWLTIPHKTSMLALLDRVDRCGGIAGSVTAARRDAGDGAIEGALFDGIGFTKALQFHGIDVRGRRALVVGAGGAGVAITVALADAGVRQLGVFDIAPERSAAVAARLHCPAVGALASSDPAGYDLVVNSTPLGLNPDDPLPFDVARLDAGAAVVDILMKDRPTPLLRACAQRGVRAFSGHEMLVQQVPDYLDFFGFDAIAAAVRDDATQVREAALGNH